MARYRGDRRVSHGGDACHLPAPAHTGSQAGVGPPARGAVASCRAEAPAASAPSGAWVPLPSLGAARGFSGLRACARAWTGLPRRLRQELDASLPRCGFPAALDGPEGAVGSGARIPRTDPHPRSPARRALVGRLRWLARSSIFGDAAAPSDRQSGSRVATVPELYARARTRLLRLSGRRAELQPRRCLSRRALSGWKR